MTTAVEAVDFEDNRSTRITVDTGLRRRDGDLPLGEHRVDELDCSRGVADDIRKPIDWC